uniref:Uncharacterized protein n=1 Tax=Romanomermis culicivorax TaxID=13658 RepID=A0A915L7K3_ROMCU
MWNEDHLKKKNYGEQTYSTVSQVITDCQFGRSRHTNSSTFKTAGIPSDSPALKANTKYTRHARQEFSRAEFLGRFIDGVVGGPQFCAAAMK